MGTGSVSWSSRKQSLVALSSTEAEYIAATTTGQEALWMRSLLRELHFPISAPTPLYMDNQSAIRVAQDPQHHGRMKHIEIRHYWLRQEVARKTFEPRYIPTDEHVADILTKPLPREPLERHRIQLGVM